MGFLTSVNSHVIFQTSGFWPRVRARALRAPVFLRSLQPQTGRCAPPPRISQLRCFLFDPQKYIKSIQLGPPTSRTFFFPLYRRGYEVPCPPVPPLPAIFWSQKYIPARPYALIFSVFLFFSFWIFFFCDSLLFLSPFQFLLILLFLSLFIHFVGLYFVFLFFSSYIFNCLSYYKHAY